MKKTTRRRGASPKEGARTPNKARVIAEEDRLTKVAQTIQGTDPANHWTPQKSPGMDQ
jgi:hypothetical protein